MYDYSYYGYDYGYDYGSSAATGLAALGVGMLIFWLIGMAISVFTIICNWMIFKKAGKPGWAAIVPIYNIIVLLEIVQLPMWYIALFFVPFANIYAMFKIYIELAHKFGKSTGFGVGMVFLAPVFMAMLAFDKKVTYGGGQNVAQPMNQQPVQPMNQQPVQPMQQIQPQPMQSMQPQPINPVPEVQPVEPVMPTPTVEPVQSEPQVSTPTFCTNCGSPLMPNTKFCTSCGKQI